MIPNEYFWNNILLLALGTIAIRGSMIAISGKVKVSDRLKELFSFIPAAILPAFIVPMAFYHHGHVEVVFGKERLVILIFATVLCYFLRSTLLTIACGLIVLSLLGCAVG